MTSGVMAHVGVTRAQALRAARPAEWVLRLSALALFVSACAAVPRDSPMVLLQFLSLAVVARLLRVPFDGATLDLEAAAIFPAVILTRSWALGAALAPIAVLLARLLQRKGRLKTADLDDAADLVLSYGASGFFYVSLASGASGDLALTLLYGGTVLVFFFTRVTFGAIHATSSATTRIPALVRAAAYQFFALLLLSPVVALVVILHPTHGYRGALLAFTSVALVSMALRNLARVRSRAEELKRQNRELETLREISTIFAGLSSDKEIFDRLFRTIAKSVPCKATATVSYEDDLDEPVFCGDVKIDPAAFQDWLHRHRDLESPFSQAAPAPVVSTRADRELALNDTLDYQVILPLQTPELLAGLLIAESDDPALIEPESVQLLAVLADHVAMSLRDRDLRRQMQTVNDRLQGRAETLQRILEVSNELKSHLTLDHVLTNIVRAVSSSLGFNIVLLSLYDRLEGVFERRAHVGLEAIWEELSQQKLAREEIARWFSEKYRISKSYFVSHLERTDLGTPVKEERRRRAFAAGEWHAQDLLFIPLTTGDQLIGVLQVDEPKSGQVPTLEDVQALEIFVNQAVTAIQSARAYETTRQMSVKDSLTDAFNHRYFQETLYRELTRHDRSGQPLALLMIDIDNFKTVNDRMGHPVGDIVLKGLVEEMQRTVREMDTVARYGGEEFALILPETTPEKALIVAERLRARAAARTYVTPDASPFSITISSGLATFPIDGNSKRALIERADQALYQAKRNGKNCVVTASSIREIRLA